MQRIALALLIPLTLLLSAALAPPPEYIPWNPAMVGVILDKHENGVEVLHVLPDSPASRARIKVGDVISKVGKKKVTTPFRFDEQFRKSVAGDKLPLTLLRKRGPKDHEMTQEVLLVGRETYPTGVDLFRRDRKATGFQAVKWWVSEWKNVKRGEEPPTLENTRGKVVVLHAFQAT